MRLVRVVRIDIEILSSLSSCIYIYITTRIWPGLSSPVASPLSLQFLSRVVMRNPAKIVSHKVKSSSRLTTLTSFWGMRGQLIFMSVATLYLFPYLPICRDFVSGVAKASF